ncbi:MAG: hypothetical protein ACXABY_15840 [Candidatus Thorarchaeota archaeon]|jgi:hypothetical protein
MVDSWITKHIPLSGGLVVNTPVVEQGALYPGSCITGVNFEPALAGGYRRITGHLKYDSTVVPGTGEVLGVAVFNGGVIAMRGTEVYEGAGSGWSKINGAFTRTNAQKYTHTLYNWGAGDFIAFVDNVNYPAKWDGNTYTELTTAPIGSSYIVSHKNHMFTAKDAVLSFSAPNNDNNHSAADGAGTISIGTPIIALAPWRDSLWIFSQNNIYKLTGSSKLDWKLETVTSALGCAAKHSLVEVGGDLLFLGPDGMRTVAGTERIGDVEVGSVSEAIKPLVETIGPNYAASGSISTVVLRGKTQFRLFYSKSSDPVETSGGFLGAVRESGGETGGTGPEKHGGHHSLDSYLWEFFQVQGIKISCAHSDYINGVEYVVHGDYDGYVHRQEQGDSFDGANVVANFSLPYITYDDPEVRKTLHTLSAFIEAEGLNDVRINFVFDYNDPDVLLPEEIKVVSTGAAFWFYNDLAATYGTAEYDVAPKVTRDHNLVGSCLNHTIVFSSNDALSPYTVSELVLQISLEGRR